MSRPVGGHYGIFTSAAKAILAKTDPYGTTFGWGVGEYYYSLNCGLSFFSLFSSLPPFLGLLLYMGLSWGFFLLGLFSLCSRLRETLNFNIWTMRYANFFWLFLSSEMTGAILASKIEIFMLGAIFLALKFAIEGRPLLAGFILGWITDWKFQPLPIVGLLVLVPLINGKIAFASRFIAAFAGSLALAYLFPVMWMGQNTASALIQKQKLLLWDFMNRDWLQFQHIYAFVQKTLGINISFSSAQIASLFIGVLCALSLILFIRKGADPHPKKSASELLLAFAIGSAYITMFSPLSQSNAYILHAPLVLGVFYFIQTSGIRHRLLGWILFAAYFLISLAYSDLNPKPMRVYMYTHAFKPVGIIVLLLLLGSSAWNSLRIRETQKVGSR